MPHTNHVTTASTTAVDNAWRLWDRVWTRQLRILTGRADLTALVAPGAAGTADACFIPDLNRVEVDAVHIGTPDITDPRRARHKVVVATAYGLLVHEAAHAAHSRWATPPGTPPVVADAAALLEESRAEGRQRSRRRADRRWLRHTVTTLLTVDDAPVDDPWHAGRVAGLLLARVDAHILTARDVRAARAAVAGVLGRKRLAQLREIWRQAHTCADDDATTMIQLGWDWCHVLGADPARQPHIPTPDPGVFAGDLAAAIVDILATAAGRTVREHLLAQAGSQHAAPATWTRRDPTPAEEQAAQQLARRIRRSRATPEPATKPAPVPPGRLRTRHAITAQAQAASGATPTATPWQQRSRQLPPTPKLHLAVLVDVSGSMDSYRQPLSAAGWILARAAHGIDAATTTIAFGCTATLLHTPHQRPDQVMEMNADGATTAFPQAVKLADTLLGLRQPGPLRMVAVVSDADLEDIPSAQQLITTLHRQHCAVLWLRPAGLPGHTFTHTTTITVADPLQAIAAIADAAVAALAAN